MATWVMYANGVTGDKEEDGKEGKARRGEAATI